MPAHHPRPVARERYANVDEAEDGVVALDMLRNAPYDFVVSDINMPRT